MLTLIINLSLKVFSFVVLGAVLGYALKDKGEAVIRKFIWVAMYILIPVFVFISLWAIDVPLGSSVPVALAACVVLAAGFVIALVWAKARNIHFREQSLPIIIMNSAYLALPVSKYVGGQEGFNYALIYNAVITLVNFTLGVASVSRGGALSGIMDLPIIYAVAAGLVLNFISLPVPGIVLQANAALSFIVLPAMLVLVGYKVAGIRARSIKAAGLGVALRMGGGFIVALACVKIFGLTGTAALICLMSSSMPSAVNNYIFAEYFKLDKDFAAATVVMGTAASFAVIPAIYLLFK
ncbi:MAG: AEC family transporter [Elusimicrobiota bacterium]